MGLDYQSIIEANKNQFEFIISEKNKLIKKITSTKYILILIIFLFSILRILPELLKKNSLISSLLITGIIIAIPSIIIVFVKNDQLLTTKSKNQFYGAFKMKLINSIILTISDILVYKPLNRINDSIIKESKLFDNNITDFWGCNLIYGETNNMTINMSELTLLKGLKKEFHGLFIYIKSISKEKTNKEALNKLTANWIIKDNGLYIAIARANKCIVKIKDDVKDLINILQLLTEATGIQFESSYIIPIINKKGLDNIFDKKSVYTNPQTKQKFGLADSSKRILNLLIDQFSILILSTLIFYLIGFNTGIDFLLVMLVFNVIYYITLESIFLQTIGKMLTKSKVVTIAGENPSFYKIGIRTLCRFIPFEQYSFIDSNVGLHDKLSSTIIIEMQK